MDGPSFSKAMGDAMVRVMLLAVAAGAGIVGVVWFLCWLFW